MDKDILNVMDAEKGRREVYIYKLMEWSNNFESEGHWDEYVTSNVLYDNVEFQQLCNKCIEEVKSIYKEVTLSNLTQHLMLHYGFKKIDPIQSFSFDI